MSATPMSPTLNNPPSPKVIALAAVMLVVPAASASLLYLNSEQGVALYASVPVWLIVVIRSALAGLSAFFAGLKTTDPQRVLDLATSPKVLVGVGTGIVAQAVVDLIAFLSAPEGQTLYTNWPPILVVAFSAVLPAIAAFAGGYVVTDPARVTPKNPHPDPIQSVSREVPVQAPGELGLPPHLQTPPLT